MSVQFDPGFAQHISILSLNLEYIYSSVNKFKNFGQRKNEFKMFYQKILQMVNNNVAFCLGSMLWAVYIKHLGIEEIINNPCLDDKYNEAEAVEEIEFSKQYFDQLKKDAKYYLGLEYSVKPEYLVVLDKYKEFMTLNKAFINTKTTDDLILPSGLKTPEDFEKINEKIQEVVKSGNLTDLFEIYEMIL